MTEQNESARSLFYRKNRLFFVGAITCAIVAGAGLISFFVFTFIARRTAAVSIRTIVQQWNDGTDPQYGAVYETSRTFLQAKPFNNTALTYHGYAAFFLALSELDASRAQEYLDEAVNSLRLALLFARKSLVPQLEYMLGKAYFYKNTASSYYYADLAVRYLTQADANGYRADDTAVYLGLSYAALGMTLESIAAFTEALLVRESDFLLLSIAEQYYKAGQSAAAAQYLYRVINGSTNDDIIVQSRILLGMIYIDRELYDEAETEFNAALEKNENASDAYYGLGVLYEKRGDVVRARAAWRRALRIQANHPGAVQKLADYR
ncbi:MAG: tetratricopeptide repeat protein [Treponema sp.]|nr:tetratricopeptide repeat protein [Treponema sp.]